MQVLFKMRLSRQRGMHWSMTSEKMGEHNKNLEARKRAIQKQRRKRIRRIQFVIYVGTLVICGLFAFFIGKRVGATEIKEDFQALPAAGDELKESGAIVEGSLEINTQEVLLVNKSNPLPSDYEVELLILPDGENRAAMEAYKPLCEMLKAGQKEGLKFEICSSYRDVAYQKKLFDEDVEVLMKEGYSYSEAYEEVAKETMPPGYSEHSTGLAFDIVAKDYQMLDAGQEKTAENQWLQEHCAEYGFILRYPKGKEDITSINYESWHFRYVGVEIATYIMEKGITLEEYLNFE